jgi:hypothetical protein
MNGRREFVRFQKRPKPGEYLKAAGCTYHSDLRGFPIEFIADD